VADQLWLMKCIREEEEDCQDISLTDISQCKCHVSITPLNFAAQMPYSIRCCTERLLLIVNTPLENDMVTDTAVMP